MAKTRKTYLGFDLGASSGRAVLGFIDKNKLEIEEINRFPNGYHELDGSLYWNFTDLWTNIVKSMRLCTEAGYDKLCGIAADTWGVDYGLIAADGKLLGQPICYRDPCTEGMVKFIASKMDEKQIYEITGMPVGRVTTLAQLAAVRNSNSYDRLKMATHFLMMPGLLRYFLCGDRSVELSAAGSSLMLDVRKGKWSPKILKAFGLPGRIFPEVIKPGKVVGKLKAELAARAGLNQAPIIAIAGHDTLSAAAALPFIDNDCAFIICGTWSVLGQIRKEPLTTERALKYGFVNEPGLESILFGRNMMGLHVFETLHRVMARSGNKMSYAAMVKASEKAKPFKCFLDMNSPVFFATQDPAADAARFFAKTGQKISLNRDQLIRSILEGLAMSYRLGLAQLSQITGAKISRLCLVGGGIRNKLLCQMVADATGRQVLAGPAEATIAGNCGVQALATSQLKNPGQIREMVRNSFKLKTYRPKEKALWDKKYLDYKLMVKKSIKLK